MSDRKYPGGCPFCGDQGAEIRTNKRQRFYMYCPSCGPVNAGGESYHDALRRIVEGEGRAKAVQPEPVGKEQDRGDSVQKSSGNSVQGKKDLSGEKGKNPDASGGGFTPLVSF